MGLGNSGRTEPPQDDDFLFIDAMLYNLEHPLAFETVVQTVDYGRTLDIVEDVTKTAFALPDSRADF